MDREEFLAARRLGIGGSDIAGIFNIGYGCKRKVWLSKRDAPADYQEEENDLFELGNVLEPFFVKKYARKTNREITTWKDAPFVHPVIPELRVNVDGTIIDPMKGIGVLEAKAQGRAAFYASKRTGIVEDYILQLNHGILVVDAVNQAQGKPPVTWGSFAIGCRDSGELMHWDMEADPVIRDAILEEGPKFWATVENGPMPDALEPDDRRCQDCGYRLTCHGNALVQIDKASEYERDESLAPLVAEFIERRAAKKEAEDLLDETKEEIMARLGSRGMVTAAGAKIQYYTSHREAYTVPAGDIRPLRIYERKRKRG